jgi:hypothetical protein
MKKGCAGILLVWGACVAFYARLASTRIHETPPILIIGILGGTFSAMLLGSIVGLFRGGGDRAALSRLKRREPPKDGRLEAASGPIRPVGAPLVGPLSGRPCVTYEYTIKPQQQGAAEYAGIAMTPCVIESARGPMRVLGWPTLEDFPQARSATDRARGEAYLRSTEFEELRITKLFGLFADAVADDDGQLRRDLRASGAGPDLAHKHLEEKLVPPGEIVTLLGLWSDAKQGFTPGGAAMPNRLYPGPAEVIEKKLAKDPWKQLVVALVFFGALHAILVPMYLLSDPQRRTGSSSSASRPSVWDERDCDRLKQLLAKGADPNEKREDGTTALMNAARYGNLPCVEALLASGARVNDADAQGDTALGQAVSAGQDKVVEALKWAGAADFRVTKELGRPVRESSDAFKTVKAYLAAVHAGDFEAMARLKPGATSEDLRSRSSALASWQAMRPKDPTLVDGYETSMAATLTVKGDVTEGSGLVAYHAQRTMEGWKIYREWFPQ